MRNPEKPRMRETLDRIDGGRVLHIGAVGHDQYRSDSKDWLHEYLEEVSDQLVGVDIDEEAVSELQASGWDIRVDEATELSTVSGPFDTIVATEVIEHLSDIGGLFEACREILAEDGSLIVSTPNQWSICYIRRVLFGDDPVGNEEHTCWVDESTLLELSDRHGYEGSVEYIEPMSGGLASVCFRAGRTRLGGTRILGEFEVVE